MDRPESARVVPPEFQDPTKKKKPAAMKKTSLLERVQILPMVTSDGVGVGIGWEN